MTPNPYESTAFTSSPPRRAVRRYLVTFGLAIGIGTIMAIPGAVLINQEWQIFPTNVISSDINVFGRPVSNGTVIAYSCATCGLLILAGLGSAAFGFRNWRANNSKWPEWER